MYSKYFKEGRTVMKLKRILAAGLILSMTAGMAMTGCGKKEEGKASVYYLNFKPEVAKQWEEIAKEYKKETGVEVKVVTAASGTYESTLKSEVAKKNPPTLFQVNGPIGYHNWKDYCLDLADTEVYNNLTDKDMAIRGVDGKGVYGIPYVVEGYGIIYNDAIMKKYFALPQKAVEIGSAEEIKDFETLKAVVEDMTRHKDELGIEGVFSSTSFAAGEDWRWQTHLANVPIYYEYQESGVTDKEKIDFTYNKNFQNIFDLYLNNSCTEPGLVGSKTVEDSMAEFALGKSAMVQNGNWGWGQVSEEKGKKEMVKLGFISPFKTFGEDEQPDDPLAKEVVRYMNDNGLETISWNFTSFPSQTFKDNFGASLLEYAQGSKEWKAVVSDMKKDWAAEKANSSDGE